MYLLAIESSCDDTSAAVLSQEGIVLSNVTNSQTIHELYGGVVPEVASRAHQQNIVPVVDAALKKAGIEPKDLAVVAFTRGPGLMGSLLVGVSYAKGLALALDIPMIEVNHIQAHVLSHFIEDPKPQFPFLCLTVSGGHTQIMLVESPLEMRSIGTTLDDAAGECFDKTGKLLGLGYPAGPIVDKLAQQGQPIYSFTIPEVSGFDFSFSGIKTNILRFIQKNTKENPDFIQENINDICASVQATIIKFLLQKLSQAAKEHNITEIALAGGVSANSGLRSELEALGARKNWNVYIPKFEYCTDNAAMIGITAWFKWQKNEYVGHEVSPMPRMPV